MSATAATTAGYELEEQLGEGGSGTVWRARRHGGAGPPVALKRLRDDGDGRAADRLRAEARALTELDHPHVVRILDVIDEGDDLALVLQLAPGGSLVDLLARRGRLMPGEIVAIAAPIADALASAHRRGLVHGDVKPGNILFTSDGEPLLSDFGVATAIGRPDGLPDAGTPGYLAPERFEGAGPDARSDVYALAVVCREALSGSTAQHGVPALTDDVPPALIGALDRAAAADPSVRTATAGDLALALRQAVAPADVRLPAALGRSNGAGGPATRTFGPRPPKPDRPLVRPRTIALGAVAVAAVLAATLGTRWATGGSGRACPPASVAAPADGQVITGETSPKCLTSGSFAPEGDVMVLTIWVDAADGAARRYAVGQPGDVALLGDWDCDGVATAGLYRPSTGEIVYFDRWAVSGDGTLPTRTEAGAPGMQTSIARPAGGCDQIALGAA